MSLILSKEEDVLFSGCITSFLVQHSTKTLKIIGEPIDLGIGSLKGIDLKNNLLLVGGKEKFRIIKLGKRPNSGNNNTNIKVYSVSKSNVDQEYKKGISNNFFRYKI